MGPDVTKYKVGDRVGVGCMVDSCGERENCRKGEEQYCLKGNVPTYAGVDKYGEPTQGGCASAGAINMAAKWLSLFYWACSNT